MATKITKGTMARAQADERRAIRQKAKDAKAVDSYQNFVQAIGMGTANALATSTYGFNPITRIRTLLEWIYRGSWLGGVAVDIPADDMTRAGIEILGAMKAGDTEKLQNGLMRLGVWTSTADVIRWAKLYGGCLGLIMIDGQDVSTPLDVSKIGKGQFKGILPLDRWSVEPGLSDLITDLGPDVGQPKFYRVVMDGLAFKGKLIHHSRVMRLLGIRLPYWQAIMENLWGLSIYERLYDRMVAFDSATMGMSQNVYRSYIRNYKIKNYTKVMSEGGKSREAMIARMQAMRMSQGNEGITILDAEDDIVTLSNNTFAGIGEAVMHIAEQLSGALQIPLTRLFGQSPGGLNSTGESDLRTYYDGINQAQEQDLRGPFSKIIPIAAASEGIALPADFNFSFNKLWQLTEDQKSQVFARDSVAIADLVNDSLISMQTGLKELKQLSRTTGRMANITDEEINNAEDLPPPKPDPMDLIPQPGEAGSEGEGGKNEKPLKGSKEEGMEPPAGT